MINSDLNEARDYEWIFIYVLKYFYFLEFFLLKFLLKY